MCNKRRDKEIKVKKKKKKKITRNSFTGGDLIIKQ